MQIPVVPGPARAAEAEGNDLEIPRRIADNLPAMWRPRSRCLARCEQFLEPPDEAGEEAADGDVGLAQAPGYLLGGQALGVPQPQHLAVLVRDGREHLRE